MKQLAKEYSVSYQFTEESFSDKTINITFQGDVGELIRQVASLANLHFTLKDNLIIWHQFETRVFDVSFIPGASQYSLGQRLENSQDTDSYLTSSDTLQSDSESIPKSERSNYSMNSDIWNELNITVKSILSPKGIHSISQSSSTLTVKDKPWKLDEIEQYIQRLNDKLSQQIYIDVQVIEVRMNDGMDYGINWDIVKQSMSLGGAVEFGTGFSNFDVNAPVTLNASITDATSQYAGSSLLINALEEQGQVSVVSSPRVVTLNNQMAEIAITEQITYLASSSSRTTANVGAETILRPGVVQAGLELYVLPLLVGDEVLLQVFGTFSTLQDITTVESNNSKIQAPNVRNKRILQKAKVTLGDTLMLAGFKNSRNQVKERGLFGQPWLSGSKSYDQQSSEMLILLSPHVLNGGTRTGELYGH
ncbi:hypothetical protein KIH87_17885 [Paraneptunicella aestuarii]|uniref:type II secretion system protein GspD n=1 Tax=Paraneptunicella aestuarii TaxID=2831148 RepID=UPI001E28EB2B|nr:hypothetical protein [Paraneptunicella aestuarii]UAA38517.1 hypothetical protein KIH87_17885 [Paraneptunicella aestuarii]